MRRTKYANGTVATLNVNTFCPISSRRFHIIGMEGEIEARWTKDNAKIELVLKGIGKKDTSGRPEYREVYDFGQTGCHGNADESIVKYISKSVQEK